MKIETAGNLLTSSLSRARLARVLVDFRKEKETKIRVQAKFKKQLDVFLIGKSLTVESPLIQTLRGHIQSLIESKMCPLLSVCINYKKGFIEAKYQKQNININKLKITNVQITIIPWTKCIRIGKSVQKALIYSLLNLCYTR